MTSKQIDDFKYSGYTDSTMQSRMLAEIAYQLAVWNEREGTAGRIRKLEDQLKRNRQGLCNLLEFRKIDGRYGALTREEIETVIAQIDNALGTANADAGSPKPAPEATAKTNPFAGLSAELRNMMGGFWCQNCCRVLLEVQGGYCFACTELLKKGRQQP